MVKTLVSEPVIEEAAIEPVVYISATYPQLKVLIDNTQVGSPPWFAHFNAGRYETADPKEIAVLDKCQSCYRFSGQMFECPICKTYSTPNAKEFGKHMASTHG